MSDAKRRSVVRLIFILLVAAGLPCVSGCAPNQDPSARRLVGKWQLMTQQQIDASNQVNAELATRLGRESNRIDTAIPNSALMTVEFLPNAVLRTSAMQNKAGTWYFVRFDESTQTVEVECKLGAEEPVTTKIRFVSNDIVCMIPPNIAVLEKELLFHRASGSQ